jgi:hypothetical protein
VTALESARSGILQAFPLRDIHPNRVKSTRRRLGDDQEEEQAVSIMFQNSTSMGLNEEDEKSVRDRSASSK